MWSFMLLFEKLNKAVVCNYFCVIFSKIVIMMTVE